MCQASLLKNPPDFNRNVNIVPETSSGKIKKHEKDTF
jgi:hypothetical protein